MATSNDEVSALDLSLYCAECDQPLTLQLDTPIGIRTDRKTPGPLCSPACATVNGQRYREDGGGDRCSCGADVELSQSLLIRSGEIIGCKACEWTGRSSVDDVHFLTLIGRVLCRDKSQIADAPTITTTNPKAITCPRCVDFFKVAPLLLEVLS